MNRSLSALCGLVLLPAGASAASPLSPPPIATFSAVAYDPATGEVGVAVQSRFFAVGSVVPYAQAGVGAVASQAYGYAAYGTRGLELMARGAGPQEAIEIIRRADPDASRRQVGMVSVRDRGLAATYSGNECQAWAGGRTGVSPEGIVFAVQGNILAGEGVVEAMAQAMQSGQAPAKVKLTRTQKQATTPRDLAGRLLLALIAGQSAGGDSRGMQSAALLVCQEGAGYGGYTDRKIDFRVDDAEDPFEELARLLTLGRPIALANEAYRRLYAGEREEATRIFRDLTRLEPKNANHHYNLACSLSLSGEKDEALKELAVALRLDPAMKSHARGDADLAPLHGDAVYEKLVGGSERKMR
jgi:uncharacterized Ntn-hydrolase superfamily protein